MLNAEIAPAPQPGHEDGIVIRSTGSWYDVRVRNRVVPSKIRGKFRLQENDVTNPVAVGDHVTIRLNEDATGLITEIQPRKNKLSRRAAGRKIGSEHIIVANIDAAYVMQSVRMPKPNPGFIDRFLVMAAYHELEAGIIVNKTDLMKPKDRPQIEALVEMYREIGYPVFTISAKRGKELDELNEHLADKVSVVAGPSGVGKSTLLNALAPDLELATGDVSEKTRKGRHTTTHAALYPITDNTYIADTPGIREFGLVDIEPGELAFYFFEFEPLIHECKFPDCTHDHEPECAVRQAVEDDTIKPQRYHSYLNILDSLKLGDRDVGR